MNEKLIDNWNSVVKTGDKVYHLGDVWMGTSTLEERAKLISRLSGSKRLIIGNHDDVKEMVQGAWFKKITMWRVFTEFNCLLTHVPVHEDSIQERLVSKGGFNLHGHTHERGSPVGPYVSACVELNNFTPVNFETIRDRMK
jgi:calcineurin-like phosphoesterase family protein